MSVYSNDKVGGLFLVECYETAKSYFIIEVMLPDYTHAYTIHSFRLFFTLVLMHLRICESAQVLQFRTYKTDHSRLKDEVVDDDLRVVLLMHTHSANYKSRLVAANSTWLGAIPKWATIEFYTTSTSNPEPAPFSYPTIFVESTEHPHRANEHFFVAIRTVVQKYRDVLAFLRVDDDAYVHWDALRRILIEQRLWVDNGHTDEDAFNRVSRSFLYMGNCNCLVIHDANGLACRPHVAGDECSCVDHVPDFRYVCGGSGALFSRFAAEILLAYDRAIGCPFSVDDMTVGQCFMEISAAEASGEWNSTESLAEFAEKFETHHHHHHHHHYTGETGSPAVVAPAAERGSVMQSHKYECLNAPHLFRTLNSWNDAHWLAQHENNCMELQEVASWEMSRGYEEPDMFNLWQKLNGDVGHC